MGSSSNISNHRVEDKDLSDMHDQFKPNNHSDLNDGIELKSLKSLISFKINPIHNLHSPVTMNR